MMRWIVRSSITYRLLAVPLAAAVLAFGAVQLRDAPVDLLPEFTPPYVEIQAEALGLDAAEVEQLITAPLEADLLNQVAWIDEIRSESVAGLSSIELIFEPGTNLLEARQMVQERLSQAGDMPNVSKPPAILQPLSSANRLMMVGLSAQNVSLIEMSVLARWKIKPRLLGVPGVANVAIWGQRERQLQVHVDPERLRQHGVPLSQVIRTTGNALWVSPLSFLQASTPGSGGFMESPSQRMGIQHVSPIKTAQSLAQVTLEDPSGRTLRIGDVANVVEDHQPLIGDSLLPQGPSLLLVVETFPGFDKVEVTKGVEAALAAMQPGLPGITVDTNVYRPATFIEDALADLGLTLVIGLALLVLLFLLVLLDWRVALITVVAIPLSFVAAALVLHWLGVGFNAMTLAGLVAAIGAVVGDAVTDAVAVGRRLRQPDADGDAVTEIVRSSLSVRGPLAYATVMLLVIAAPLLLLGGMTGAFIQPVTVAYILALLASTLVALAVTPALAMLLLARGRDERRPAPMVRWLHSGQIAVVTRLGRRNRWVVVTLLVLLAAGIAAMPALWGSKPTLPTVKDRTVLVSYETAPGTSHGEMSRISTRIAEELRGLAGVAGVGSHIGRAVTSDQTVNINSGQLWLTLDAGANYDDTVVRVRDVVGGYPGIASTVRSYQDTRIGEVGAEADRPLVVRIYGQDATVLENKAKEVRDALAGIDGVESPRVDLATHEPTVEVEVNLEAAQRHGVKPGDVRRAAATVLSGVAVGSLFEEQKVFDVVVWGTPEARGSLAKIQDLLIDTPSGKHVRLGDVAEVRIGSHPIVIKREAVQRRVDVVADISGRSPSSVLADVDARIRQISFPVETHAEVRGRYAEERASGQWILTLAITVAVLVFLLLQAAFGSWRLAIILLLTVPTALAGAALAAVLAGGLSTVGVLFGMLAVLTIAIRQAVLLVAQYQRLESEDGVAGEDLVLQGTREQVTPTVLTLVATALVLLPFVILGGGSGQEVVYSLAVAILGGLVTTALLTLFVIPALYLAFVARRPVEPAVSPASPATGDDHAKGNSDAQQ